MTEKNSQMSLAKLMMDNMKSGIVAFGFTKTKEVTTQVAPTEKAPDQRSQTVIRFERSYGIQPEDEDGWRKEWMTLTFTDASIADAVHAYVEAEKNPVSVEEQEQAMRDDEFDTTILDDHDLQPAMDLLIGHFGAVYMPGSESVSESDDDAGITLGLGRMLSKDGEDSEMSGLLIVVGVDGPGKN